MLKRMTLAFCAVPVLCNHHLYLGVKYFHHPQVKRTPSQPSPCVSSSPQPLTTTNSFVPMD